MANKHVMEILVNASGNAPDFLGKVGGGFDKMDAAAGKALAGGLTAAGTAILAVGVAAFDTANDIDTATDSMVASLDLTASQADYFEDTMKGVFANNFGDDFDDIAASITTVEKNLRAAGQNGGDDLQQITEKALALRDVFETDVGESTNAAATLMKNFGISSAEAFDFITAGYQRGLDSSGDFLDSIGEYSTQFASAGADAGQFFSAMETGFQGGMLGTDRISDLFKEFRLRINDGSDAVSDAAASIFGASGTFANYGEEIGKTNEKLADLYDKLELARAKQAEFTDKTKESTRLSNQQRIDDLTKSIREQEQAVSDLSDANGTLSGAMEGLVDFEGGVSGFFAAIRDGSLSGADAFNLVIEGLRKVEDPIQRMQLGTALLGTQFEDMGDSILTSVDLGATKLGDLAGATDGLNAKYDNLGSVIEGWKRRALLAIAPIGEAMLDLANDKAPIVEAALGGLEATLGALFTGDFSDDRIPESFRIFMLEATKLRLRWKLDLDGMRSDTDKNWIELALAAERLWTRLEQIWGDGEDEVLKNEHTFWDNVFFNSVQYWNLLLERAETGLDWINGAWSTAEALIHGEWSDFWEGMQHQQEVTLEIIAQWVESMFGPNIRASFEAALDNAFDGIKEWWSGVVAWWGNLRLPSLFGGETMSIPGYASGTPYAPGGLSVVHGGEMILPRGAQVLTANQVQGMGGGGDTYHVNISLSGSATEADGQRAARGFRSEMQAMGLR